MTSAIHFSGGKYSGRNPVSRRDIAVRQKLNTHFFKPVTEGEENSIVPTGYKIVLTCPDMTEHLEVKYNNDRNETTVGHYFVSSEKQADGNCNTSFLKKIEEDRISLDVICVNGDDETTEDSEVQE